MLSMISFVIHNAASGSSEADQPESETQGDDNRP